MKGWMLHCLAGIGRVKARTISLEVRVSWVEVIIWMTEEEANEEEELREVSQATRELRTPCITAGLEGKQLFYNFLLSLF